MKLSEEELKDNLIAASKAGDKELISKTIDEISKDGDLLRRLLPTINSIGSNRVTIDSMKEYIRKGHHDLEAARGESLQSLFNDWARESDISKGTEGERSSKENIR